GLCLLSCVCLPLAPLWERGPGGEGAEDVEAKEILMNASLRNYVGKGEKAALRYALGVPRQAPVGLVGGTLSQRSGPSLGFRDHRAYEPGDDLRHIDWSAYARTDQLTIKLFREEVSPILDVVIDTSKSMDLEGSEKGGATAALAAFFVTAAARSGYTHTTWLL